MEKEKLFIGVVGSRRRNSLTDQKQVGCLIEQIQKENPDKDVVIVSGAKKGADAHAEFYANLFNLTKKIFPVVGKFASKWEFRVAAFARNRDVAQQSTGGIFCWIHSSRTGGTENTIQHAMELKIPIYLVTDDGKVYLSPSQEIPKCEPVRHLQT
jgi:hypothetical protein